MVLMSPVYRFYRARQATLSARNRPHVECGVRKWRGEEQGDGCGRMLTISFGNAVLPGAVNTKRWTVNMGTSRRATDATSPYVAWFHAVEH